MNINSLSTIDDIECFLSGSKQVAYAIAGNKAESYQIIKRQLIRFNYYKIKRHERGTLIAFIIKITGYSRQQITRLVKQYIDTGDIVHRPRTTYAGFTKKYCDSDIALLVKLDELHDTPNGAAVKKICERAVTIYGQQEYETLSSISVSHIYNLRKSVGYIKRRRTFTKTKYKASSIGERRPPQSNGKPGYIRIDTVHQGDQDGVKGVYHINAVDEVTQFEIVVSVERISEAYLLPALQYILDAFPFNILGFHSDNGSEYINKRVKELLEKLRIEFTKSRPRHSNDNGLAESKNASVVRKVFGYSHIPQHFALMLNEFNKNYLNPYVNYHRPCYFPEVTISSKGKRKIRYEYKNMATPYEKFKALPSASKYLRPGVTIQQLDAIALQMTDNEAAGELNQARKQLFNKIYGQSESKMTV